MHTRVPSYLLNTHTHTHVHKPAQTLYPAPQEGSQDGRRQDDSFCMWFFSGEVPPSTHDLPPQQTCGWLSVHTSALMPALHTCSTPTMC